MKLETSTTPQPSTDSPVRDFTVSVAILAALVVGAYYTTQQSAILNPQSRITLIWDANTNDHPGTFSTEVWASTNLTIWTLKTNVTGTNAVTLPATNRTEFFKIRNKGTNGSFSDWSRKPTL